MSCPGVGSSDTHLRTVVLRILGGCGIGVGSVGLEKGQALRKATCPCVSLFLCEGTSSPWLLGSVLYHLVISTSSYEVTSF